MSRTSYHRFAHDVHGTDPSNHHALVIGGSIAGLLAARVLRQHFRRVTIVERDDLPSAPLVRRGAPQASHNHVLLLRGRQLMEELLPGLEQMIVHDGGLLLDMANDLAWCTPWGWGVRFASTLVMLACSRALLEWRIRRMLEDGGGVSFATSTQVDGLVIERRRISGVHTTRGSIDADLVVDASGRGSHASRWLERCGYRPPRETAVNAFLGYASRFYRPAPDQSRWWKGLYIQAAPPHHPRVGVILPIEGGLWHVTLGGGDRQYPPSDENGFLEFARTLRTRALYDAIRSAEPCSPISITRSTENRRRHFERSQLPEGFVVTGDAACAFNPVYGQGMTIAALGARVLADSLRITRRRTGLPHGDGLGRRFQTRLAAAHRDAWMLAIGEDLRYHGTEGASATARTRLQHRYMDAVGRLTTSDPVARLMLLRAFHMIARPAALFAPRIAWRVFSSRFRASGIATQLPPARPSGLHTTGGSTSG